MKIVLQIGIKHKLFEFEIQWRIECKIALKQAIEIIFEWIERWESDVSINASNFKFGEFKAILESNWAYICVLNNSIL